MNINPTGPVNIRAALLCTSSDLPATRKLYGFASHAASFGCSKCLKKFPYATNKLDFSGFERNLWTLRNLDNHRIVSAKYKQAKTKSEQDVILKAHGVRYSILLQLPYFDGFRFHIVDAMHNLLLGTAKNVIRIWCESGILTSQALHSIQSLVNSITVPVDVCRIPSNIAASYYGFTADQ